MPATLICGRQPGMTALITAQIHSGEYPGTPAIIRTALEIDPAQLKGNLILVHCVNTSGFWARSNGRLPEDGANLNGCYPGRADGTPGERIADYFVKELFPHIDFLLDLHSGGQQEPLTPCLFFPCHKKVRAQSLSAAAVLDIPYLIESSASTGEYSYAAAYMDIPGLLLERGHCGSCHENWIHAYQRDIRLLLQHMGMYDFGESHATCKKTVYHKTIYMTAGEQGLWYPAIQENQRVEQGQLLGHTEDFFGRPLAEYRAEAEGTVFYYTSGLSVLPGSPLVAYGVTSSASPL